MLNYIIFGVILFHLLVGLGWLFWKLEMQKTKPKEKDEDDDQNLPNNKTANS